MEASRNGQGEAVKLLIEEGAAVNYTNDDEWTALILASRNEHGEVVQLLN